METQRYLNLIDRELKQLPDFVSEYQLGTRHSLTTSYQYLTELRRFFTWLRKTSLSNATDNAHVTTAELERLRRNDIMQFIDDLAHTKNAQQRLNSPTTINRSINALRSLFKYLTVTADINGGQPYLERNVMLKIDSLNDTKTLNYRAHVLEAKMYTGQLKYDFLTFLDQEYEQKCDPRARTAFEKNKERDIALVALILGTGIRVSETAGVDVNDLDLKGQTLEVTRKGGQRDAVPIAPWTMPYILAYATIRRQRYQPEKTERAFFLTHYHGQTKRISVNGIERLVSKYSRAFGHPLTPHKLRHTLASELYDVTKDQVLVAQQLGQKGTSATDLYTHVDQTKQRQALDEVGSDAPSKEGD